jgi:hypothetical protein
MAATGIAPRSLDASLAARSATVQDRWFARLYLLKPVALLTLAAITIAAGLEELMTFWIIAPVIGAGILVRATSRLALSALLVVTILGILDYALRPSHHLNIGLLHALAFQAPMLLAIVFTLAILDDR